MTEDKNILIAFLETPIGLLRISANEKMVTGIDFDAKKETEETSFNEILELAVSQLSEYFSGVRIGFSFPINLSGTDFQKKVWRELSEIEFGKTTSYLELSRRVGDVKAIRAVGLANGKNKLPIVIPCHRVIGSNGKLVGYSGGLWRKKWLLKHEAAFSKTENSLFGFSTGVAVRE